MTDVRERADVALATVLTVRLQVVSANSGRPLHGRPVRLWRCDRDPVEVRISDESGWTEFDGLLPPTGHLHFEIPHHELDGGHRGRLTLPVDAYGAGRSRRALLAAAFAAGEPVLIASVTGDHRRGLVATRTLACAT